MKNPEGEGSGIHWRPGAPGLSMKNPEGKGSAIHLRTDVGGVFMIGEKSLSCVEHDLGRKMVAHILISEQRILSFFGSGLVLSGLI
jgi:hypothetical protein